MGIVTQLRNTPKSRHLPEWRLLSFLITNLMENPSTAGQHKTPDFSGVLAFFQTSATHSTSHIAPLGSSLTPTQLRAGLFGKYSA